MHYALSSRWPDWGPMPLARPLANSLQYSKVIFYQYHFDLTFHNITRNISQFHPIIEPCHIFISWHSIYRNDMDGGPWPSRLPRLDDPYTTRKYPLGMQKVCKPVTTIFRTWVFAGYTLGLASPRSLNLKRDIATTQYRHRSTPLLGHTHGINRQSHQLKKEKVFVVQSRKMMDSKIGSLKNSTLKDWEPPTTDTFWHHNIWTCLVAKFALRGLWRLSEWKKTY